METSDNAVRARYSVKEIFALGTCMMLRRCIIHAGFQMYLSRCLQNRITGNGRDLRPEENNAKRTTTSSYPDWMLTKTSGPIARADSQKALFLVWSMQKNATSALHRSVRDSNKFCMSQLSVNGFSRNPSLQSTWYL